VISRRVLRRIKCVEEGDKIGIGRMSMEGRESDKRDKK
jgi:hypothetical protein